MDARSLKPWLMLPLLAVGWALGGPSQAATLYFAHTDAQGSVVAVTDSSRNLVERREYEPYGLPRQPVTDDPGYTGHVHDAGSGLVYMQQRYYDPEVGRFLSVDPVGVSSAGGNFNRYWYANNNPYTFVDPDGEQACDAAAEQGLSGRCFESRKVTGAESQSGNAVGTPETDRAAAHFAQKTNQVEGNEQVVRMDVVTGENGENSVTITQVPTIEASPTSSTFEGVHAKGATGIIHTHPTGDPTNSVAPGRGDWQVTKLGTPNYIAHGERVSVVEVHEGRVRVRVIEGELSRTEERMIQRRVNEFQGKIDER